MPTREQAEHFTPMIFSLVLAVGTASILAWATIDGYPPDWSLYLLLDWAPVAILIIWTVEGLFFWGMTSARPSLLGPFVGFFENRTGRGVLVTAFVFLIVPFLRYFLAGILAISAAPLDWATLATLLSGGIALYSFEVWLGYLFMKRKVISAKLDRVKALGLELVRTRMDRTRFVSAYEEMLERETQDM